MSKPNTQPPSVESSALVLPLSDTVEAIRNDIAAIRSKLKEATRSHSFRERFECVEGLLTSGLIALHSINADLVRCEIKWDDQERGRSLKFSPRGIGLDSCPGCFVCGAEDRSKEAPTSLLNNISAFVSSKQEGSEIVAWFGNRARLDYRPSEPNWIQLKVGACDAHMGNLEHLYTLASRHGVIRERDVTDSVSWQNVPALPTASAKP